MDKKEAESMLLQWEATLRGILSFIDLQTVNDEITVAQLIHGLAEQMEILADELDLPLPHVVHGSMATAILGVEFDGENMDVAELLKACANARRQHLPT